jgi:hypothetical protein
VASFLKRVLFWAPRLLCIAFILFLSLFALDTFDEFNGFGPATVALLIHLVPSFIFTAVLLFAWMWDWIGAVLFSAFAVFYAATNFRHPSWVLTISGPLFVVGLLFLASWLAHPNLEHVEKRVVPDIKTDGRSA